MAINSKNELKIVKRKIQEKNSTCDGDVKVCEERNMGEKTESLL